MMTAERRQAIIRALNVRRFDTREHLAQEFNVTTRTITTDVLVLSLSYPIYTTSGNKGGIYVMEDFHLNSNKLGDKEISFLKRLSLSLSGEDQETMNSIIQKIGG